LLTRGSAAQLNCSSIWLLAFQPTLHASATDDKTRDCGSWFGGIEESERFLKGSQPKKCHRQRREVRGAPGLGASPSVLLSLILKRSNLVEPAQSVDQYRLGKLRRAVRIISPPSIIAIDQAADAHPELDDAQRRLALYPFEDSFGLQIL